MNDCLLLSEHYSQGESGRFGTFFLTAVSLDYIIPVLLRFSNSAGTWAAYQHYFSDQPKQHLRASVTETANYGGTYNRRKRSR